MGDRQTGGPWYKMLSRKQHQKFNGLDNTRAFTDMEKDFFLKKILYKQGLSQNYFTSKSA